MSAITEAKAAVDAALLQLANALHAEGQTSATFTDGATTSTDPNVSGMTYASPCVNGRGTGGGGGGT